jgi:hypothetical protein
METSMTSHPYRILLGASLALLVGAAGAQNAPDKQLAHPGGKRRDHDDAGAAV